jgi:hypothetical protein
MSMGLVPLLFPESWDVNEVRANVITACDFASNPLVGWGFNTSNISAPPYGSAVLNGGECVEKPMQPHPDGRFLLFNRIIGGIRFRQERARLVSPCAVAEPLREVYDAKCYETAYNLEPSSSEGASIREDNVHDVDTKILLRTLSQSEVRNSLRVMEDARWFNESAQKVEVSFIVYNANTDLVTQTQIQIFVTRGGH